MHTLALIVAVSTVVTGISGLAGFLFMDTSDTIAGIGWVVSRLGLRVMGISTVLLVFAALGVSVSVHL